MPTKLNSRDVLLYLNEMGYRNINAQQLKEFMQDLKKLIKYEERRRLRQDNERLFVDSGDYLTLPTESTIIDEPVHQPLTDVFTKLHSQGTVESKAKIVPKKESIIRVQIKRPKPVVQFAHPQHDKENQTSENEQVLKVDEYLTNSSNTSSSKKSNTSSNKEDLHHNTPEETVAEKATNTKTKRKPIPKKSVSFIRPVFKSSLKTDPVALYHKYKAEWSKVNIPGENNRDELRWAIREKMLRSSMPSRI